MRRLALFASVLITACAATPAPPVVPTPPPSAVDVAAVPTAPAPDTTQLKARADEAVKTAAKKIVDIGQTCWDDWLETNVACPASAFTQIATDYQAYYSERGDPRHDDGTYYSLPRLGGATRTVEQVTDDLVAGCEDNCRAQRNGSITNAVDEAVESCRKVNTGYAACKTLEKKIAKNVRASEVERWEGSCEHQCEEHRATVRYRAESERNRPKTKAEAARCEAACHKQFDGGWCGTGIMGCLADCSMKRPAP